MKSYLTSLASFFLFCLGVLLLISFLKSGVQGNKEYSLKYDDLINNHPETNAVVFGSSHIFRQFQPESFDNITEETYSYNLGTPAADGLQNVFLLEDFLDNYDDIENIEYVMFEYMGTNKIRGQNHLTLRNSYYLNPSTLKIAFETYSPWHKAPGLDFLKAYLLRKFSFKNIFFNTERKRLTEENKKYCLNKRGYLALETDLRVTQNQQLVSRKNYFDENEDELIDKFSRRSRTVSIKKKNLPILERINELSLRKEHSHITFIIVIHPIYPMLKVNNYKNLSILNLSNKQHKNILSNPDHFFDKGHLGKKGAKAFSKALGRSFRKKSY